MTTNEILQRIYKLYPPIHAWTKAEHWFWPDVESAQKALSAYIGPNAQVRVFECYHIRDEFDRNFLRSEATWKVIEQMTTMLYHHSPQLRNGYLIRR